MRRDSFILYTIHRDAWMSLSDEDAGKLIKAVLAYQCEEPVSLPPVPTAIFSIIKAYLDRDATKWAQTVEKRRAAGAKGGVASGESRRKAAKQTDANEANASSAKQNQANEANALLAKQTEANEANPSCIDVSCYDMSLQDPCVEKNSHTHKIYGGTGARVFSPLSGEDIAERQDAVQDQHRRGDYEFSLVREAYNAARQEGELSGRQEFLALYNSSAYPGHDEIIAGINLLCAEDDQFQRGFAPSLAKFLTQRMWTMKPRAPVGQEREPELTPERLAARERIKRMEEELKQKQAARAKVKGW